MAQATIRPSIDAQHASGTGVQRGSRLAGSLVALAIASSVSVVTWPLFGSFFAIGIPAATVLGAWLGPSVRNGEPVDGPVIVMAFLTIPLAEIVLIVTTLAPTMSGEAVLFLSTYGLLIVGAPMLIVTIPCSIVWALAIRFLVRRGIGRGVS